MGFSSLDDIKSEMLLGKGITVPWNKVMGAGAYTSSRWYNTFTLGGNPIAGTYPAVALTATTLSDISGGIQTPGAIQHGGNKSTDTKHLINAEIMTSNAFSVPAYLLLVDVLAYYQGINMNSSSAQNMLSSNAGANILPNRQGVQHSGNNVFAFLETQATTGATALPFTMTITYTNSALASGRIMPGSPALGCVSSFSPHIIHSTSSVGGTYCPFLPLQAGDTGISSIQSFQLSGTTGAGTACLVLCEPIAKIPIIIQGSTTSRDFIFNPPSLPQIKDGACLNYLLYAGVGLAASTTFYGQLDFVWG